MTGSIAFTLPRPHLLILQLDVNNRRPERDISPQVRWWAFAASGSHDSARQRSYRSLTRDNPEAAANSNNVNNLENPCEAKDEHRIGNTDDEAHEADASTSVLLNAIRRTEKQRGRQKRDGGEGDEVIVTRAIRYGFAS